MKVDILAFGAHPDDVELGCGGTLAKMVFLNKKVGIIDLTQGELGTRGSAEIRKKESEEAAKILKVAFRENLNFKDGFFKNDEEHQLKVLSKIRQYQPDIVLCNAPQDRHIDHPKGSKLILDSCFLSGLKKITSYNNEIAQEAWRPNYIFHYIQWQELKPDFIVNLEQEFLDTKVKSVLAYKSQFYDETSSENNTPISSKNFLESVSYRAKNLGRLIGKDSAEGFITSNYLAINNFDGFI